jgi:hypothetical protein
MCIETTPPIKTRRKARKHAMAPPMATPIAPRAPRDYRTNAQILDLLRDFKSGELPRAEWTHAAHLIVALCYARLYPAAEALRRLRAAIQHYNVASAKTEAQKTGYHETITLAWFHLVRHFLDVFEDGRSLPALADALVELYSKDELRKHYTRDRLLSAEARATWVAPDLAPLPELGAFTRQDRNWLRTLAAKANEQLAAATRSLQTVSA